MSASTAAQGLSSAAARARLASEGHNELPRSATRSFLASAAHALAEPMFLLLLVASGLYLVLGDRVEAAFLLASVAVIIGITIYQERKTERVLEALRDLSSPRALVIRDGVTHRIAGREVVRGDLLLVREGDRVAADARVVDAVDLHVDESLLTGESVPVRKGLQAGDAEERLYAGTLVVKGHGRAEVVATGSASEMGRIGESMGTLGIEATALQAETRRLVRSFSAIAILLCAILAAVYGLTRGDWLTAMLAGLTLAMAILPEEFPVVLTVFLALGAWRMSHVRVLTRRIAAIEALGAATVLCVDKTGTLTQNRMSVQAVWTDGELTTLGDGAAAPPADRAAHARGDDVAATLPARVAHALAVGRLASEPDAFDPMEHAFHAAAPQSAHPDAVLVRRYPLTAQRLAVVHAWQEGSGAFTLAAKGAPEAIVALCALPPAIAEAILGEASRLAAQGLRVLGLAARERIEGDLTDDPALLGLRFVGLAGLADPLRAGVPAAMHECRNAGVRVVMITGDYPVTARAIATQAGLSAEPAVLTGRELDALDDATLAARLPGVDVFARVVPAQKLRIVRALQARGEIVAMTGDGVNDGPALKAANIGIAMGGRGSDVAREAAALVLLDDDFGSMVRAIRQGRRIFDNLRKAMSYLVAVHIPIAGLGLVPVLAAGAPLLFPAHVVFLEFIIDPACSIAFEAEPAEPDVMRRPPRDRRARLIGGRPLVLAVLEGVVALAYTLAILGIARYRGGSDETVRLCAFSAVVFANLSLIFFTRSGGRRVWRHIVLQNRSLWLIVAGALAAYGAVVAVPWLRAQFHLAAATRDDALLLGAGTLVLWVALAALNVAHRRLRPHAPSGEAMPG